MRNGAKVVGRRSACSIIAVCLMLMASIGAGEVGASSGPWDKEHTIGKNAQWSGMSAFGALNADDGTQWVFKPSDQGASNGDSTYLDGLVVGPDSTIYTLLRNPNNGGAYGLYAINPDGTVRWFSTAAGGGPGANSRSMVIGPDGTIYCIVNIASQPDPDPVTGGREVSYDYHLRAIDPLDGSLKWEYISPGSGLGPQTLPAVSPSGELIFRDVLPGSTPDGQFAFSPVVPEVSFVTSLYPNGSLAWRTPIPLLSSPIAVSGNGTIYAMSSLGYLYAIQPDGTMQWNVTAPAAVNAETLSLDREGAIYATSSSSLSKYDTAGELVWTYSPADAELYGPPLVDDQGRVYLGFADLARIIGSNIEVNETPGLLSLDRDGGVRWKMQFERGALALGTDGTLFVASNDHFTALGSDGDTVWRTDALHSPYPVDYFPFGGELGAAVGLDGTAYYLGSLTLYMGQQDYIMAVKGTPSAVDPGLTEQYLIPVMCAAGMAALLIVLFMIKRRDGGQGE